MTSQVIKVATDQQLMQSIVGPTGATGPALNPKPILTIVSDPPASVGNWSGWGVAFTGDLSKVNFPIQYEINGAATLGQPTSGYKYTEEVYPVAAFFLNNSGWNQSTSGNDGRTSACYSRVHVQNSGQGDCVAYNATGFVNGPNKPGATNVLANPAVTLFNGGTFGGADGVFLNPVEINTDDQGHDVAAVNFVANQNRANATAALSAFWNGYRSQSKGSVAIDSHYYGSGKVAYCIDLSLCTISVGGAVLVAPLTTPASSGATGKQGSIVWDANFIYICTSTNTWKRAALSSF